jgi:hypothetical protein
MTKFYVVRGEGMTHWYGEASPDELIQEVLSITESHKVDNEEPMPNTGKRKVQLPALLEFAKVLFEQWRKGREKYGHDLETFNGRNVFEDAKQELADAWVYIIQAEMENKELRRRRIAGVRYKYTPGLCDLCSKPAEVESRSYQLSDSGNWVTLCSSCVSMIVVMP